MSNGYKITAFILVGVLALITYYEAVQPEPINWYPSYSKLDKIPLGTYVFYDLLKDSHDLVKDIDQPPYEFLVAKDTISGTYFFINEHLNFESEELDNILQWVNQGNTLFISAKSFGNQLLDTLHLKTDRLVATTDIKTQPIVTLTNKFLRGSGNYSYNRSIHIPYFSKIDTTNTKVLGSVRLTNVTDSVSNNTFNYISQSFGKGTIILHAFPEAFGNYFMLTDQNYQYTQNLLAYVSRNQNVLWDNYYKSGKISYSSPLYLLFKTKSLKWAYYTVLFGVLLFVIFESKRKQRSIPILTPLKNQTVAFAQTISAMYLNRKDHKAIATMQIQLFYSFLREELRLTLNDATQKNYKEISLKTGNSEEVTKRLFQQIAQLKTREIITNEDLINLVKNIHIFKKTYLEQK
ncbi:DUF4350 domain-containing protein [Aquimarina sp. W85]|uniref:DUF4350 domain-containing protein n=1 Tax=Aquimarina rhodophyticola TaxID=3342246 RepID=UPI00366C572A